MEYFPIEPRTRKYIKDYRFSVIRDKSIQQIVKAIIGCCYKNRTRCPKNYFRKKTHKAAEGT